MDNYLKQISEGTSISATNPPEKPTSAEKPILEAKFNSQITKSDKELIAGADDIVKPTENIHAFRAVKVRKYQLYKNRGE